MLNHAENIKKNKTLNVGRRSNTGNFLSGVFILSFSTVIVKLVGLACKIPLISLLGAEGMGYFNSAYEIYALLCVISTAGLPVALSMLVSAQRERGDAYGIRRVYHVSLTIFMIFGIGGSLIMLLLAHPISVMIGNPLAVSSIAAIAPALACVCFSSAVRGYFQGFSNMLPTAISQLIEAICKLVFGVVFAYVALRRGADIPRAAACAVLGLTVGTLLSALYLMIIKMRDKAYYAISVKITDAHYEYYSKRTNAHILSTLLKIALPITLGAAVLSLTRMIDMALILRRLGDIGANTAKANEIYGAYTTLALPIFSLVPSLIAPISLALVPQLSAAIENGSHDIQSRVFFDSLRLTVLLAMPASMGITIYAYPILSMLFSGQAEAIDISAPLLSVLGASVLFSGIITTTNAILQSYRRTVLPIISMTIGAVIKTVSAYILLGIRSVGIFGAPISTFLCNACITLLNLLFVLKTVPNVRGIFSIFIKAFLASIGGIGLSVAIYIPLLELTENSLLSFITALLTALLGYFAFAILVRAVTKDDISLLPLKKDKIIG